MFSTFYFVFYQKVFKCIILIYKTKKYVGESDFKRDFCSEFLCHHKLFEH